MDLDLLNTGVQSDEQERDLAGILEEFRRKANESSTENTEDEIEDQVMQSMDWEYEAEQFFNDTTLPDISDDEDDGRRSSSSSLSPVPASSPPTNSPLQKETQSSTSPK